MLCYISNSLSLWIKCRLLLWKSILTMPQAVLVHKSKLLMPWTPVTPSGEGIRPASVHVLIRFGRIWRWLGVLVSFSLCLSAVFSHHMTQHVGYRFPCQ